MRAMAVWCGKSMLSATPYLPRPGQAWLPREERTCSYFPCLECARAIVQSGIRHLHTLPPDLTDPVWGVSFGPSQVILREGGVQLHFSDRDAAATHAATMAPLA